MGHYSHRLCKMGKFMLAELMLLILTVLQQEPVPYLGLWELYHRQIILR